MNTLLTREDVEQRVVILKRLKKLLAQQREKFQSYLSVLDAERSSIDAEALENLEEQVRMEEQLVDDIQTFQRVIDPLERMIAVSVQDSEIAALKDSLGHLRGQVEQKSLENRGLLSRTMELVQKEVQRVRPQLRGRSPYSGSRPLPAMVDIST